MDWKTKLSQSGYRISGPRKRVMELLESADRPLTPQAIYQKLTESEQALGLASVYRTLDLLTRLGIATVVYNPDGSAGYMAASIGHHHHILCCGCHKAMEFTGSEDLHALFDRVEQETGFMINDHLLQLYGLCPECRQRGENCP